MISAFAGFMLGVTIVLAQAALFGMLAIWLASRPSRAARILGAIGAILIAWASVVAILNRASGYRAGSDLETNISIVAALVIGWIAGANRRLRITKADQLAYAGIPPAALTAATPRRVVLDGKVRVVGICITLLSQIYGVVVGLIGFAIGLNVVSDVVGFPGAVIAFLIAPVTFAIAPLYAGLRLHNWFPAALCYGGVFTMWLVFAFGKLVSRDLD